MQRKISFRQKLGGVFALLLALILLHGTVAWFALQEYNNLFSDLRVVDQIVEITLRAHMNEKDYVGTGERHLASTVQEEIQEAQRLVSEVLQKKSSPEKSILEDMSNSLDNYMTTFSQYVIYEDQHRALESEGKRLLGELLYSCGELRKIHGGIKDEDFNRINWLLLTNEKNLQISGKQHTDAEGDAYELAALAKNLRQEAGSTKIKLATYHIGVLAEDYLQVVRKIKALEKFQRGNEDKMAAAAEEVQSLGKLADKNQQERAQYGKMLTTNTMIAVFLLSTIVVLWGTFYLSRRLIRPLRDLVDVTSSLGQGHFNARIQIEGDDEFHNLLHSINQMAENIADLNCNMEQLVEERTKAFEMEKIRFQKLFENSPEGILIFDEDMRVLAANHAFTAIFGYPLPEILHQKVQDFLLTDKEFNKDFRYQREEALRRCKDGRLILVSIVRYSFQQIGGQTLYYAIYTDISERKAAEERLHFLSFHDSLTSLKNRTYFELEMERLQQSGEACGIIVCDVDGLKYVNDNWGHAAGDQLLKDAAQVLMNAAPARALARVGGDEFVIFMLNASEEETRNMAALIAEHTDGKKRQEPYPLVMSVGYAYRENKEIHMEELFSSADKMMYSIKNNRRKSRGCS